MQLLQDEYVETSLWTSNFNITILVLEHMSTFSAFLCHLRLTLLPEIALCNHGQFMPRKGAKR